jgi:hypothetical protein
MGEKPLNRLTFTRTQGQMDYQDAYSENMLTSWHFQPLPDPVCNTFMYMFQADHHSPCIQEHQGYLSKWLFPHSTHICSHERLVMAHINTIIPDTLDSLQFAHRPNRFTDDVLSIGLHTALSHLDKRDTYSKLQKYWYWGTFGLG